MVFGRVGLPLACRTSVLLLPCVPRVLLRDDRLPMLGAPFAQPKPKLAHL